MQAIGWLNLLIREIPDIKFVITSGWRWRKDWAKCLYKAGFKGKIIGKTDMLYSEGDIRAKEIQKWLNDNKKLDIEDYIILDDEYVTGFETHLIKTHAFEGFKYSHYQKILDRWRKKEN